MHKSARDLCYENGPYLAGINVRIGLRLYLKGQSEHCASMSKLVASPVMAIDSHSLSQSLVQMTYFASGAFPESSSRSCSESHIFMWR